MLILGVIPARGGSKGVKGKNIKQLGDKPLIAWTIEAAKRSNLSQVIVSTDSEDIAAVAREYGAEVPFLRPSEMATDSAKALPVQQHALRWMEEHTGQRFDALMMLQPTAPFRTAEDINAAIETLARTGADSVISVVDVEGHHPARMKYLEGDRLIDPPFCEAYENQARQELPVMYIRSGAVYLTKREVLLEQNSFKGKDCRALVMPAERAVNIDTELDFKYAQFLLKEVLA